jgi:acetyl esterase/lipase
MVSTEFFLPLLSYLIVPFRMSETAQEVHQPLHPSIIPRVDPQYIEFHNKNVAALTPVERLKWHPSMRDGPAIPGSSTPLEVGKIQDFDLTHSQIRTYVPKGEKPAAGWPVLLYFHGGGWTYGNMNSEASLVTNVCARG